MDQFEDGEWITLAPAGSTLNHDPAVCEGGRRRHHGRLGSDAAGRARGTLDVAALESLLARLGASTVAERARLPGMEPKRADVIVAGCAIVLEALRLGGFDRLTVSDRGLRWGLLHDRFGGPPAGPRAGA